MNASLTEGVIKGKWSVTIIHVGAYRFPQGLFCFSKATGGFLFDKHLFFIYEFMVIEIPK